MVTPNLSFQGFASTIINSHWIQLWNWDISIWWDRFSPKLQFTKSTRKWVMCCFELRRQGIKRNRRKMQPGNHQIEGKYLRFHCEHEQGSNEQKRDAYHAENQIQYGMQCIIFITPRPCTWACERVCMCAETQSIAHTDWHTYRHTHIRAHSQKNEYINLGAAIIC